MHRTRALLVDRGDDACVRLHVHVNARACARVRILRVMLRLCDPAIMKIPAMMKLKVAHTLWLCMHQEAPPGLAIDSCSAIGCIGAERGYIELDWVPQSAAEATLPA